MAARRQLPDIMGEALGKLWVCEKQNSAKVLQLPADAGHVPRPLLEKLGSLRLKGMVDALKEQADDPSLTSLSFEKRLEQMVEREAAVRKERRLRTRLKKAGLRLEACMDSIDFKHPRGLDKDLMAYLGGFSWIKESGNLIISGPTGIGKTYLACALAHQACVQGFQAGYRRLSQVLDELASARKSGVFKMTLAALGKLTPLILDDWGLEPLDYHQGFYLLELFEDRFDRKSTVVVGKDPLGMWPRTFKDKNVAEAVWDRLVHNAYRIELKGESLRKKYAKAQPAKTAPPGS